MDISDFKFWIGELFNKENPFKTRFFRFFVREKYIKEFFLFILGYKTKKFKSANYKSFLQNGYFILNSINLSKIKELKEEIKTLDFISASKVDPLVKGEKLLNILDKKNNSTNISHQIYRNTNVINESPIIKEIAFSDEIISLVKEYLRTENFLVDGQIWFTFKGDKVNSQASSHNFGWHYDIDDLHWVKVFIYLNDVDKDCGPHEFLKYSHLLSGFKKILMRRIDKEDKFNSLKLKNTNLIQFTGKAGTAFIEDTFGYHRGVDPIKNRAILQFTYRLGIF